MAVNNDTIFNSIHQLETLIFYDDIFNKIESHPLMNLRDQLQKIDGESELRTIDEIKQLISSLNYFEINCVCHFIKQYFSIIPSTVLEALFDTSRLQIYLNMVIYPSICDYYFDLSLTYLISDSTINYLIEEKISPSNIDEYFLVLFSSIGSRATYTKAKVSYSVCISRKNIPTFFQLNHSTERLLRAFITYLNNCFLNNDRQRPSFSSILKWINNITNIYGFIPYFLMTGYPDAILQWMSIEQDHIKDIDSESWACIFGLSYNLARHPMAVEAFNKLKMIDIIKRWKDQYIFESPAVDYDENNKEILITYYLLYAILLEPKQLKKESISNVEKILDYILERTIQAFNSDYLSYGSFNVCEYLNGLAKLVVNDTFLVYIISRENIYELLIEKFLLFDTICETTVLNGSICSSLYTIFWSISFLSEYNIKLKSNDKFLLLVKQRVNYESKDEHALVIRQAAKGILFNLDCLQMDMSPIEDNGNSNDDNQIKVMISYSHKDDKICRKLVLELQQHFQGDIWVDFIKLSPPYEDDWEEIAKAITECDVILMIVTENYCSSKSCRREVVHADKRHKRMVPIYIGTDYTPEDWFEIRAGSATWVRFRDTKSDEEVIGILLGLINVRDKVKQNDKKLTVSHDSNFQKKSEIETNTINNTQTIEILLPVNANPIAEVRNVQFQSNSSITDIIPTSPIEEWTSEEVQRWLCLPPSILNCHLVELY
ncbi:unnamed protein product [Rotaria sp. Silwood2]|nr:unnamed protein product [Rotaria sp. Silwood2]CAF3988882.1 unnamed protein product [Rotaria sp. Silwood2]CAF4220751.1 unnamed protein product [Rotaria sp. Silwood2]